MKAKIFYIGLLLNIFSATANAQERDTLTIREAINIEINKLDPVFSFINVDQVPEFPGGQDSMFKYIQYSINYPEEAEIKRIEGRVFVTFVVEKDGSLSGIRILRGVHELLD